MSPKKPTPFEQPPRADSSSDDEEEVSDEEEEVSEESEEEEEPKKTDPKPDSSSEEDESDEEVTPVAPVKPVEVQSSKIGAQSKQKQPDAAPAPPTAPASTVAKLGKKRPVESKADGKDSKKLKKVEDKRVAEEEDVKKVGEDTKKQLFQRLFSQEDEIEMLKALLDYSAKKCIDPIEDFNDFHDFVKNCIHVDVSSSQLSDKIKRMKKKFKKNASKTKEGVDKIFGKPHEQLCYDLSKKIWGKAASASGGGSELKANGGGKRTPKQNMTPDPKEKRASSLQIPQVVVEKEEPVRENSSSLFCLSELAKTKDVVGMMGLSDDLLKKGFELLSDEARAALEEKWKNMATAELELYYNRLELSCEHVKLSLDALKASGHRG